MAANIRKKGHPKFNVPNFGAKSRKRVPERWRKQRGIDNKKRIKKDFMGAEPTIGYKNPDSARHVRATGRRLMVVHNQMELSRMISAKSAHDYDIAIAAPVSRRKRVEITRIAMSNGLHLINGERL